MVGKVSIARQTWHEVRDPETGKLLFKYDPEHNAIHLKHRTMNVEIDLESCRAGRWGEAVRPAGAEEGGEG